MKYPRKSKNPIFIHTLVPCMVSLFCVFLILTIGISQVVSNAITETASDNPVSNATQIIIAISAVGFIVLSVLLFVIMRQTLKPVRELADYANKIAARERALVAENDMLDRLNTMKTMFFQNLSHDFKTPLTVISVNILDSAHMLDYEIDIDELRENLDNAQREVMRMSRMVDSTIKQAVGQGTRQGMEPLDLSVLLRESAEIYRSMLARNGNTLTLDMPSFLPEVLGSADTLLLVLANLLSNANRYTRNGLISIYAGSDGDDITVSVADSGSGIKPEQLRSVFRRGVSDDSTGLGLSICKNAIEAHGGEIGIESESGDGTIVWFTIPIADKK